MAEILRSGAGNRSGISDLVFGLPHGDGQCVCAAVPGAGVDELFKNGENRGTVAGYFNQFPACHEGIAIAFLFAFVLGMFRALFPGGSVYYEYIVQFFRNVPPLSMIPLLILWCGIGETTKTVIIVLASFFPMYLNIVKGFTGCDSKLLEVGDMFGYSKRRKFFRIILPYAMADILVGMRIGLGYSWRAIIGAEMVAASTGLGHMILFAQQMSRTDKVIVGILAIGAVGYVTDRLFGWMIGFVLKGSGENGWN